MKVSLLKYDDPVVCEVAGKVCTTDKTIAELCAEPFDPDYALFQRIMDYGHTSISEHTTFTFGIEGISRSCSHQLVRNRIASYSQRSQRYVEEANFKFVTPDSIKRSPSYSLYVKVMKDIAELYKTMLDCDIPAEDARFILPNACETTLVATFNIRSLINFINLRLCAKAQWEIRKLAMQMKIEICKVFPMLEKYLVPKCKVVGYCTERKCCGLSQPRELVLGSH